MSVQAAEGGFALIELIVLITILGILVAFALPRFASLETEARIAATEALGGRIRSGSAAAHSLYLVDGTDPASVDMEGTAVAIVNGYPSTAGIDNALSDYTGFAHTPGSGVWTRAHATTPASCSVTYDEPAALGKVPTITVDVTGC